MTDTLHEDADDLLHWLNAHSVSISDGIPFSLMQQKWMASQRSQSQLRSSLEWLFAESLLTMTPGLEQPHVRLTTKGFEQLLRAMDNARQPAPVVLPPPAATAFKPAPLAPAVPAPAPPPPAVAAAMPAAAEPANTRFLSFGKPPTEIALRNEVLTIFRDLKLVAGQQLIAMTLTRYWQESGHRTEHLRAAIDVVLRDGYLLAAVKRYENYWALTADGHAFLSAPISNPALVALAQPLRQIEESHPDEDLRRKSLTLFKRNPAQTFMTLESSWRHSRDSLIHALDLLLKGGDVQMSEHQPLTFELTGRGAAKLR